MSAPAISEPVARPRAANAQQQRSGARAKFLSGSIMRHIVVMTASGGVGLMAMFLVEFLDLLFLGLLKDVELTAAVGYSGSIVFLTTSVGIGLSIATAALVAPALGAGNWARAKRLAVNAHMFAFLASAVCALIVLAAVPWLLTLFGARGRTHALAVSYLQIVTPSLPLVAVGMCASAVLRSLGDARRSMWVMLSGAAAILVLDPLFIFGFGLGIRGAAWASVLSRTVVMIVGLYWVGRIHGLLARPKLHALALDSALIARYALPSVATNIATPIGGAYITAAMARFGDEAVAGWAIVGRTTPMAFVLVFAMSGSIGPIIGQNLGARDFGRVRLAIREALLFTLYCVAGAWALLALMHGAIAEVFNATDTARQLIAVYCLYLSPLAIFLGALFIVTAALNNLGRPNYATALNWGRATLGTIPIVHIGAHFFGPAGVMAGHLGGSVLFSLAGIYVCHRLLQRLEREEQARAAVAGAQAPQ